MKKIIRLISFLSLLHISGSLRAQSIDIATAKKLVEKGAQGDIILGKEYRQKQLSTTPQQLQNADLILEKKLSPIKKEKMKNK
jgi:hypothetical protein